MPRDAKRRDFMKDLGQKFSILWEKRFRFECRAVGDIFWEARRAFVFDGCMNLSAALAFYTILSLIPFLLLLISAAAYILGSSEAALKMALSFLSQVFPQAGALIFGEMKSIAQRAEVIGLLGFLSMAWTASIIFSSLEFAMGIVFRVEKRRDFFKKKLLALSMVPGAALLVLFSFSVAVFSDFLQGLETNLWIIHLDKSSLLKFLLISYIFPYLVLTLGFTAIYKIVPNTFISFRHALVGGASCAFLFELAKHFFTWYIRNYARYSVVYGSLEALIILVLWAFYSACILLFCAEVVSAYRRRDITLLEKAFL
jgi:membrane protein